MDWSSLLLSFLALDKYFFPSPRHISTASNHIQPIKRAFPGGWRWVRRAPSPICPAMDRERAVQVADLTPARYAAASWSLSFQQRRSEYFQYLGYWASARRTRRRAARRAPGPAPRKGCTPRAGSPVGQRRQRVAPCVTRRWARFGCAPKALFEASVHAGAERHHRHGLLLLLLPRLLLCSFWSASRRPRRPPRRRDLLRRLCARELVTEERGERALKRCPVTKAAWPGLSSSTLSTAFITSSPAPFASSCPKKPPLTTSSWSFTLEILVFMAQSFSGSVPRKTMVTRFAASLEHGGLRRAAPVRRAQLRRRVDVLDGLGARVAPREGQGLERLGAVRAEAPADPFLHGLVDADRRDTAPPPACVTLGTPTAARWRPFSRPPYLPRSPPTTMPPPTPWPVRPSSPSTTSSSSSATPSKKRGAPSPPPQSTFAPAFS